MCTRKQALEAARAAIGHPHRYGGRWMFYVPWTPGDPASPRTPVFCDTYAEVRLHRARRVVTEALYLIGATTPAIRAAGALIWTSTEARQNQLWLIACREADRVAAGLLPKNDGFRGGLEAGV